MQTMQMENIVFLDPLRGCKALAASGRTMEERLQTDRKENMIESQRRQQINRRRGDRCTSALGQGGGGRVRAMLPDCFLFALCRERLGGQLGGTWGGPGGSGQLPKGLTSTVTRRSPGPAWCTRATPMPTAAQGHEQTGHSKLTNRKITAPRPIAPEVAGLVGTG